MILWSTPADYQALRVTWGEVQIFKEPIHFPITPTAGLSSSNPRSPPSPEMSCGSACFALLLSLSIKEDPTSRWKLWRRVAGGAQC